MSRKKLLLSLMVAFSSILFLTVGVSASASGGYVPTGTYVRNNVGYIGNRGIVNIFDDTKGGTGITGVSGVPKNFKLIIKDNQFIMSYSLQNKSFTFEGALKSILHGPKINYYLVSTMNGQRLGPTMREKYLSVAQNGDIWMEVFNKVADAENGTLCYASLRCNVRKSLFQY